MNKNLFTVGQTFKVAISYVTELENWNLIELENGHFKTIFWAYI